MAHSLTRPALIRRGLLLEYLTVGWNILEGLIAIVAGLLSGSVALVAFGMDSLVEIISGLVLIWRLRAEDRGDLDEVALERTERRAELLVGAAFMVLAAYVTIESLRSLLQAEAPEASPIGIVLTALSIVVMLWLARAKRETGEALGSRALIADSKQTRACWYLSAVALVGLALNALLGWWWADPLAALAIAVLLVREGWEALSGEDDD
jgi:cation diffusion facilitator family transporter